MLITAVAHNRARSQACAAVVEEPGVFTLSDHHRAGLTRDPSTTVTGAERQLRWPRING
jgi:hypothetical protein